MQKHFTVGLAGHVDHGKTTLTKALTGVDTDRLKEEKERQISIEPGFAPLHLEQGIVSIVDVPGHERFIRQMIAGVSGIDLMLLVVAADEGVMPQTREHLDILKLLGVGQGIVVMTKVHAMPEDLRELVEEEIREALQGTVFADAPILQVDSLDGTGIVEVKSAIAARLAETKERNHTVPFRMSIDQVFTIKGSGTVVRGTVTEGIVREGEHLSLLPVGTEVRVRQVQVHGQAQTEARAGQRAALNLAGLGKDEVARGDVLAAPDTCPVTEVVDVRVDWLAEVQHGIKQRSLVKCHMGTAEVMAKVVFFDRNEAEGGQEGVLCQLRLEQPVASKRGDHFILRRPSPVETLGGGTVIDPQGGKYRFGQETVEQLARKLEGTPMERIQAVLQREKLLEKRELLALASITEAELEEANLIAISAAFTSQAVAAEAAAALQAEVGAYHENHPMRPGISKAQLLERVPYPKRLLEQVLPQACEVIGQHVALHNFIPHFPGKWAKRMERALETLRQDGFEAKLWDVYMKEAGIPQPEAEELSHYLLRTGQLYLLDKQPVSAEVLQDGIAKLRAASGASFSIQEAKDVLGLSRKTAIPFLELLDNLGLTERKENRREWRESHEGAFAPAAARP
ncbi:selenocysteine-specific translation elongation factor [Ectobacillus ponti]|uniref:Selenocysteine-specific elongation factor n=1 Tax=Ectobacillus ponti TaxID=2961894 RepID=A0AA41X3G3_9BACI|nr:selenocysteine-specific translation elongation factor [Ectobacillus ponti]MCP8968032.1 selenocysteine-specific translation elongation factor [Ectobacillus ponti]